MNNDNVLVSVVLVCYNQSEFISQALDSILMQKTDFRFEVLVGDDASSDNTAEIVGEYCQKYPNIIRFVRREENVGATRNAFELMLMCEGEFIAYIEGDDYWTDDKKLQKQTDFLREHQDYLGCTSKFIVVSHDGIPLHGYKPEWVRQKKRFTFEDFDGFHLPSQSSTYLRRNIYKKPLFDLSVIYKADRTVGDRVSAMVYLLHGDYYCFDEEMTAYRLPDPRRACGTVSAYSDPVAAFETELRINTAIRKISRELGREIRSDYLFRRLFYSAWIKSVTLKNKKLAEIAAIALEQTDNKLVTILLFPVYVLSKIYYKLSAKFTGKIKIKKPKKG